MVNARSSGRRNSPVARRASKPSSCRAIAARSSSRPAPVIDETATIGAPARARAVGQQFDLVAHFTQARRVGEVGLGDDEDAAPDAEQMKDVQMLLALRHHAVVGRDGEQHQVDSVRAGQHVADETLVAGDVNHARARTVGQREIGEAQVDRNPAFLFFLEAVGVLAGERLDQRGLAVIDMAGGADDGVGDGMMGDGGGHGAKLRNRAYSARRRRQKERRADANCETVI